RRQPEHGRMGVRRLQWNEHGQLLRGRLHAEAANGGHDTDPLEAGQPWTVPKGERIEMSSSTNVIQEAAADVVVLGLGVTGGIVATELALAGYKVVGIEKGPYWDFTSDFAGVKYDEWGIGFNRKFDHPLPLS